MLTNTIELWSGQRRCIIALTDSDVELMVEVFESKQRQPRAYLDLLDEDDLPQNSDVALILGQAEAAMEAFKNKYYAWNGNTLKNEWKFLR